MSLNGDASCAAMKLVDGPAALSLTLHGACATLLPPRDAASPLRVALSLATGELYQLLLRTSANRVCAFELLKVAASVPARAMCPLGPSLLFLGSMVADSLLLQLEMLPPTAAARKPDGMAMGKLLERSAKRRKLLARNSSANGDGAESDGASLVKDGGTNGESQAEGRSEGAAESETAVEAGRAAVADGPAETNGAATGENADGDSHSMAEAVQMAEELEEREEEVLYGVAAAAASKRRVRAALRDSLPSLAPIAD
eukprot:2906675-Pleurochrysis_carterae.AAC.2